MGYSNEEVLRATQPYRNSRGTGTSYVGNTSTGPYRGNLQTNFEGNYDPRSGQFNSYANDSDADVRLAQELTNQMSRSKYDPIYHANTDSAAIGAQLDAVKARIAQKNALGQSIGANADMELNAENDLRANANQAMSSGIKNTRENFNNRGLLYSGMRQGGEQAVRSGVAANMASGLAGTKREYSNLMEKQKQAYASVGLANAQRHLDLANEAFDTVTKNNVARAQAMQQLGEGVGAVAGAYFGGRGSPKSPTNYSEMNPNSNNYERLDTIGSNELRASNRNYGYTG